MPRRKKQEVKINDAESLSGLIQETYNDACLQITDAQKNINELSTATVGTPTDNLDIDDLTKVYKEKGNLLKVKDSAIKIKLEIAKLQSEIIKNNGDSESAVSKRSDGAASLKDFNSIRELLKNDKEIKTEDE